MINFDEELKNFKPILEIEKIEEDLCDNDVLDIVDLLRDLVSDK